MSTDVREVLNTSRSATGSPLLAQMSLPWQQGSAAQHFARFH